MTKYLWLLGIASCLLGCSTSSKTTATPDLPPVPSITDSNDEILVEQRQLDTLFVTPEPEINEDLDLSLTDTAINFTLDRYNPSAKREHDLLHTKLDIRFNWEKEEVIGKAELTLKPYFKAMSAVTLDAKGFEFKSISLKDGNKTLEYTYDDEQVTITLDKTYQNNQEYTLLIDYIARPSETGGSAAITSDKGLFFINPDGTEDKPQQIWTQGETEWNSRWFPTIDKPNERCTQELSLTVKDKYVTLSNGLLVSSKRNNDGTRTDYWKMDQPHAPYLFMITVGEFAVVRDQWKDIPLSYYVEPEFEEDAPYIFPHTPEMLGFFSDKLNFKYPWQKYAQIVVRDYVSGAMENTTAVIFGDFMQRKKNELVDYLYNEKVVAHEMFHHWFGDYVTCESWANLTMNEGFANYSEYVWLEHKYGRDEADAHMLQEWQGYLSSATFGGHPLIHYSYDSKEDMFDAHSYNKGGSVLHMLREYVGEEAFWAALNSYLTTNSYSAVEAHDLRLAFEKVTGEDLNWFWDQWYFSQGHPIFELEYGYNDSTQMATFNVKQVQDPANMPPIFQIPSSVLLIYKDGTTTIEPIWIDQREQLFEFKVKEEPAAMAFDPSRTILSEITEDNTPVEAFSYLYKYAKGLFHRVNGLQGAVQTQSPDARQLLSEALEDPYWAIRALAMTQIDVPNESELISIRNMAANDPHSSTRSTAFETLTKIGDTGAKDAAVEAIQKDSVEAVVAAALNCLSTVDSVGALKYIDKLKSSNSIFILTAVGELYARSGETTYLPFFEDKLEADVMDGFSAVTFYDLYQTLLIRAEKNKINAAVDKLYGIATNPDQPMLRRAASTIALFRMLEDLKQEISPLQADVQEAKSSIIDTLRNKIREIKEQEKDDTLISIYLNIKEE